MIHCFKNKYWHTKKPWEKFRNLKEVLVGTSKGGFLLGKINNFQFYLAFCLVIWFDDDFLWSSCFILHLRKQPSRGRDHFSSGKVGSIAPPCKCYITTRLRRRYKFCLQNGPYTYGLFFAYLYEVKQFNRHLYLKLETSRTVKTFGNHIQMCT